MTSPPSFSLYNQSTLGDDDFVANFVARHEALDVLVRRLGAVAPDDGGLHHVLIGPRGMGKTSLLRRIAIAIARDPQLADRYVPLGFREEQYNVLTIGDFWRNCGEALAEWAEASGNVELAARLDSDLASSAWRGDEDSAERFANEMTALGRRAVLLVDNIDLILEALSDNDQWTLRRYLQAPRGPIVVGAATEPLKQATDRAAAFYEFFQPHYLEPLNARETEACMRALASRRGEAGAHVLRVLDRQPERLKTLHTLTGGNPRILTLIYRLLESEESEAAMADLDLLLDQVTPYYKARVEEYRTAQQRKVIDAIALHWDPITTSALSDATDIVSTTLSPLLAKLRKDGLIETVDTSGSYSAHQLSERFLNIWYLMRHGTRRAKQKMRWLVAFLTSFYSSSELARIARDGDLRSGSWNKDYALAFNEALAKKSLGDEVQLSGAASDLDKPDFDALTELHREADRRWHERDYEQCLATLDQIIDQGTPLQAGQVTSVLLALANKGIVHQVRDETEEALAAYDASIALADRATTPLARRQVAVALLNKASIAKALGDPETARAAREAVLTRFGEDTDPLTLHPVIYAKVSKAIELSQMGDSHAALVLYDEVIERFVDSSDSKLAAEAARALFNKGVLATRMGDQALAIEMYDRVSAGFVNAIEPDARVQAARGMVNKGSLLHQAGDEVSAQAAYDDVIRLFGDDETQAADEQVAMALLNKGVAMGRAGDYEGEIGVYDTLLARLSDAETLNARVQWARAAVNRARALLNLRELDKSLAALEGLIERLEGDADPELREPLARALLLKGRVLQERNDPKGAIAVFDEVISRMARVESIDVRQRVLTAFMAKGTLLGETGDTVGAVATYDEALRHVPYDGKALVEETLAGILFNKAGTLHLNGDAAAARIAYGELIETLGDTSDPEARVVVATGLLTLGSLLAADGDVVGAIDLYERVVSMLAEAPDGRQLAASARVRQGGLFLDKLRDPERAEVAFKAAAEFAPTLGYCNLAWAYLLEGRLDDALVIRARLTEAPPYGLALLEAGYELARHNLGLALEHLAQVLAGDLDRGDLDFSDDLDRFLRLSTRLGHGEALLNWFESSGFSDRYAPIHIALRALVRGEKTLLDANLEVRHAASQIYERLVAGQPPGRASRAQAAEARARAIPVDDRPFPRSEKSQV